MSFVLPAREPAARAPGVLTLAAGITLAAGTPLGVCGVWAAGVVLVAPGVRLGGIVGAAADATWVGVAPAAIASSPSGVTCPNWLTTSPGVRAWANSL